MVAQSVLTTFIFHLDIFVKITCKIALKSLNVKSLNVKNGPFPVALAYELVTPSYIIQHKIFSNYIIFILKDIE